MYTTEGIVLERRDAEEADYLYSIYTKEYGKIRARAQGVRKEAAKLKGHLEVLSRTQVSFVMGKGGERLTQAFLLDFWPGIRAHPFRYAAARYLLGLVDEQCMAGERDESIWELLVSSLEKLNGGKNELFSDAGNRNTTLKQALARFLVEFEIHFLSCLGYNGSEDIRVLETQVANPFYNYK